MVWPLLLAVGENVAIWHIVLAACLGGVMLVFSIIAATIRNI
ncbi:MAG: hypothetical protein ABIQ01_05345 [Pseudolysinimonas sp.]